MRKSKDDKFCNRCGTKENLIKDKLGRIHRVCKVCHSLRGREGAIKGKLDREIRVKSNYIDYGMKGSIINIPLLFFEKEYIYNNILIEELSDKFGIHQNTLRKYLKKYSIEEYHICRHCKTKTNLLVLEGRVCNCCCDCWKKTYKGRSHCISKTIKKGIKHTKTTAGIGINSQLFFKELEQLISKFNIEYEELCYGIYDECIKQIVRKEKIIKGLKKCKHLDFYIKIQNREICIEFDESHHRRLKNKQRDCERELIIKKISPNIEIYRIPEFLIKEHKKLLLNDIIKILIDKNNVSYRLRTVHHEFLSDLESDKEFDSIIENYYQNIQYKK